MQTGDQRGVPFGKYRVVRQLGEGAFGVVYEALLPGPMGFTKKVAIKRIRSSVIEEDPRFVQSMVNEARIGGLLHHANIVDTLEFGQHEEHWYIAMELVDGPTLADVVRLCREHRVLLPRFAIVDLGLQICRGLQYAHELEGSDGRPLDLVHRDLKPSNIILDRAGTAKLLDFGIARAASNLFSTTTSDQVKGTPRYMAPEQVSGEAEISPRTDLFSLGAVLYEVITGRVLFDAPSLPALVHKIIYVDLGKDLDLAEEAFPGSGALLRRLLQRDPGDRYPDTRSLAGDLRELGHNYPPMADMSEVIGRLLGSADAPGGRSVRSLGELDDTFADESAKTIRAESAPGRTPVPHAAPSSAGWDQFSRVFNVPGALPGTDQQTRKDLIPPGVGVRPSETEEREVRRFPGACLVAAAVVIAALVVAAAVVVGPVVWEWGEDGDEVTGSELPVSSGTDSISATDSASDTDADSDSISATDSMVRHTGSDSDSDSDSRPPSTQLVQLIPEPRTPSGSVGTDGAASRGAPEDGNSAVAADRPGAPHTPDSRQGPDHSDPDTASTSDSTPVRPPDPTPTPPTDLAPGTISVSTTPWSQMYVDGVLIKSDRWLKRHPVDGGTHEVRLVCSALDQEKVFRVEVDGDDVKLGCWDFETMAPCTR